MIVDTSSRYKVDIVHLSAYSTDSANINFQNCIRHINFLQKEMKSSYLLNVLYTLWTKLPKRDVICLPEIMKFHNEIFWSLFSSSKCAEVLNELFNFLEMEGDSLLRCAYKMVIIGAGHRKDVKISVFCKILSSKCGTRKMPFSNFEIYER